MTVGIPNTYLLYNYFTIKSGFGLVEFDQLNIKVITL